MTVSGALSFIIRMEEVHEKLRQAQDCSTTAAATGAHASNRGSGTHTPSSASPPKILLADCRFQLGQPHAGRDAYRAGHLPGAVYWDLEEDLSGPVGEHGGRHPMPDLGRLLLKLGERGFHRDAEIIAYDDQGGAMASRFWWLLRFLGASNVKVMDGGYTAWLQAGYPVTDAVPSPPSEPVVFGSRVQNELLVVMEDVRERLGRPGTVLIDSREPVRFRGEQEPIDRVAGHIPGAVNRFWRDALSPDGRWLPPESLRERFACVPDDAEVIVYCGSGVTACPNVLALAEAGRPDAKLYLGSWSDWIGYAGNPVATGDEQ